MPKDSTGSILKLKGKIYARVTWTDEKGKRREARRRANDVSDARRIIRELITKIKHSGTSSSSQLDNEKLTFDDLSNHYEAHYAIPPIYVDGRKIAGLRAYRDVLNHIRVLRQHFHKMKLNKLSYSSIEQFKLERLSQPLQRTTKRNRTLASVHRTLSILRTMLHVAEREGWISRNPFAAGKPLINLSHELPRERIITRDEEAKLLMLSIGKRANFGLLLIAALDTGMRRGELLSLQWDDINFSNDSIKLKALNTKTERERVVPLSARLREKLLCHRTQSNTANDYVFTMSGSAVQKMLDRICSECEISNARFHDMRHTFATRLIQAGMPLAEVSRLLGHTTLSTTYRHYVNADINTINRATELLNAINDAALPLNQSASTNHWTI
jgi:integrase